MAGMDDLRARIVGLVSVLEPLELPLADAHGCVLAAEAVAQIDVPGFDTVSIEGLAVRAVSYAPTESLRVIDEVPAGFRASEELVAGTCIRVWPGAPLPPGADAVVPVHLVQAAVDGIRLPSVAPGTGFVRQGALALQGAILGAAGDPVTPELTGELARAGLRSVLVRPRPRVLAVTVGTQYVEPGVPTPIGLVADHLSFPAVAIAEGAGAMATRVPPILDEQAELVAIIDDSLHRADLIILCGLGASARASACAEFGLAELASRGESGCAIGDREGAIIVALGPDLEDITELGGVILPAVIGRQRGLAG